MSRASIFRKRLDQRRNVEHVAQHFAVGLEDHREGAELRGHGEQIGGPLPLLPERRPSAGATAGKEQRARGRLAELRGEERGAAKLPYHQRLGFVRGRQQQRGIGRRFGLGKSDDEPVVGPHRLGVAAGLGADAFHHGHRPRRVDASAERRQQTDPPVAELVARPLDHDGAVVGHGAGGGGLVGEIAQHVLGRARVEVVVLGQPLDRRRGRHLAQAAHQLADVAPQLQRPSGRVRLPERHLPRLSRSGGDQHAIVGDLLDAPRRGAEQEGLADAALEDHLFVQLADARGRPAIAGEEHAVEAAVGNRAAVDHRDPPRPLARDGLVLQAVPRQPRAQIREVVRRVAARQHVEHAVEDRSAQLGERRRRANRGEQRVHVPALHRDHRDDLLRQHVQRVARIADRFDLRLVHRAGDRGARDQVAAVLGEDDAAARLIDGVARPSDALHAARDRRRRLDLDHQVDRAHVDPELERRGRDQAANQPGLQLVFDLDPLRPGERSVVRPDQLLARELVDRAGEPLRHAAAVDEDQRRAMRAHQFEQPWVDRAPDRRPRRAGGGPARDLFDLPHPRHVLDRHFDLQLELLLLRSVHDRDRAIIWRRAVRAELVVDRSFCDLRPWSDPGLTSRSDRGLTPV